MTDFQEGPTKSAGLDSAAALISTLRDNCVLGLGAENSGRQAELITLVAQSYLIAATSGLRYLSGVAQTYVTHQDGVLRCVANAGANKQLSEEDQHTVTESFRTYLREIGDLAEQEARLLRVELG